MKDGMLIQLTICNHFERHLSVRCVYLGLPIINILKNDHRKHRKSNDPTIDCEMREMIDKPHLVRDTFRGFSSRTSAFRGLAADINVNDLVRGRITGDSSDHC